MRQYMSDLVPRRLIDLFINKYKMVLYICCQTCNVLFFCVYYFHLICDAILFWTEDSVVHEFAALCLSAMAVDYSTKVTINEQNGLEALIRCLSSNDPDVQKNAIETISLMLQVKNSYWA